MTVRITEAEFVRDVRAELEKVEQGSEVIIEHQDHRPPAVIHSVIASGRPITEILSEATQRNSTATLDDRSAGLEPAPQARSECAVGAAIESGQ